MKKSLLGGLLTFLLATSCCWLPALVIGLGGASFFGGLTAGLEKYSPFFFGLSVSLFAVGAYQFYKSKQPKPLILSSVLRCPNCGFEKEEEMPTNACQFFYECSSCKQVLKPQKGDCCVFCSYGSVACPPIQLGEDCCA